MDILAGLRCGEGQAREELVKEFYEPMLRLAQSRLTGAVRRHSIDSGGLVLSAFSSLARTAQKPNFQPAQWRIGALLTRIVKLKCAEAARKPVREFALDGDEFQRAIESLQAGRRHNAIDPPLAVQVKELIDRAVAQLTEEEQQVVHPWLDVDDYRTIGEIASACGCSIAVAEAAIEAFEAALEEEVAKLEQERASQSSNR